MKNENNYYIQVHALFQEFNKRIIELTQSYLSANFSTVIDNFSEKQPLVKSGRKKKENSSAVENKPKKRKGRKPKTQLNEQPGL